jgi:dihydrolipoamide dehydrogenase
MGKYHARIAAAAILGHDIHDVASQRAVPRVTFTDPQVAAVGLTATEAAGRGLRVRVVDVAVGEVPGSYVLGEGLGGTTRLVIDEDRGVLAGVTVTGSGVQELLHAATVAVSARIPLTELWHAVPAFPTVAEVWLHALDAAGL